MTQETIYTRSDPKIFMFDDGRHAGTLYQMEPPLTPGDLTFNVDLLVDSGADTLFYHVGLEGGVVLYDSKVAPKWGENVTKWKHPVWYRASRNIKSLIDQGHDPLNLLCERAHQKGIWFIATNWVGFEGGDRETSGGLGRKSDFVYDNPQFQVGPEDDSRSNHVSPERFSFLHPEVREKRFVIFEELLDQYTTDGIELNLTDLAPLCKFSEVDTLAPIMTQWIQDLRDVAINSQKSQGRKKRIFVRIPAHPDAWSILGYDVRTWVEKNLVDGLICMPDMSHSTPGNSELDQHMDLSEAVDLVNGSNCRVFYGLRNIIGRDLKQYATPQMTWAAAANAYSQGAHGFGVAEAMWSPNGWPWTSEEYDTLRILGHPEMLAMADKLYRVRSAKKSVPPTDYHWIPGVSPTLPKVLDVDQPVDIDFRISDDVSRWNDLGRVESVKLRVRITSIEPSLNEIEIYFNDALLPDQILKLNDSTFRILKHGAVGPYGHFYEYLLTPDYYPNIGNNSVKVVWVKADTEVEFGGGVMVYDVDFEIKYRRHRNFEKNPVDY